MEQLWHDWTWTERFPACDELRRYFEYVDDKLDLSRDIQFDTRVTEATFDPGNNLWHIVSGNGDSVQARYFITCTGFAAKAHFADFPGINDFAGPSYHTGHWPQEGLDMTGLRVGPGKRRHQPGHTFPTGVKCLTVEAGASCDENALAAVHIALSGWSKYGAVLFQCQLGCRRP